MPEKLMTIGEVSEYLKISEEEVKRLVDIGEIPAYRIGDTFLRFRKEQIDAIRREITDIEESRRPAEDAKPSLDSEGHPTHRLSDLEVDIKRREPSIRQYDYTPIEKVKDFFYFNDFYILSFVVISALMYLIFK